jgi:hypothetical protein
MRKFRCGVLPLLASLLLSWPASARDDGRYAQVDPDLKAWIEGLSNRLGINCCAEADGFRPEAVEWDIRDSTYRVRIDGEWYDVPDYAVIRGPNRLGVPVVWLFRARDGAIIIVCFLPGSGT